jgi:hypothetical protein
MIGTIAAVGGLLAVGFVVGRARPAGPGGRPAGAARGRIKTVTVVSIVAFPAVTLMLAKLCQSDLLGWVFGLTLIAGLALLPCAAIFYFGLQIGSRTAPGPTPKKEAVVDMVVQIDRTDVHASDDAPSRRISVAPDTTLRALLALATADTFLPSISGGKATWVVESSGAGAGAGAGADSTADGGATRRPVAVCAQQWPEVKFLVTAEVSVATHFGAVPPRLNFHYRSQQDPDAVVAALGVAA